MEVEKKMARTVESIVGNHMAARRLRAAGKPIWAATARVKSAMAPFKEDGDEMTAERAVELAKAIHVALKSGVPKEWFDVRNANYSMDFEELFERFEKASVGDFTPTEDMKYSPCEVMNTWLEELFDWGDRYRVWLD